ncbi:MAG TPA: hypothetical protein VHO01_04720 [Jatrophihabitans sp.]|nr:hypothetical protein [Jatrophihabitans sp.]
MTGTVSLSGGSAVAVDPDQLERLATHAAALAHLMQRDVIGRLLAAARPGPAAAVDPVGAAAVLAHATASLSLAGVVLSDGDGLAGSLRLAAVAYRDADSLDARLQPLLRAVEHAPAAGLAAARGHLQAALVADPGLADAGVQLLTGLDPGLGPIQRLAPTASAHTARGLARLYPDPGPVVAIRPGAATLDRLGPPRSVADLLDDVALCEADDDAGGAVDVRILTGPSGRRVIVDIAGTTSWDVNPLAQSRQASNFATNLRCLANEPGALSAGVRQALRMAGVGSADQIMLVGHSQGGMVAGVLAAELNRDHEFTVSQVVTAGSPIGLAPIPPGTQVLSLENRGDVVPELDGAGNPRRLRWLTAHVNEGAAGVLGRHSIHSYRAGAADFDADQAEAARHWRQQAAGFFDASAVQTTVFQIGRN